MMNLKELVAKKIEELGDEAPAFFGKTAKALKMYLKVGNIPISVAQKVLDDLPQQSAPVEGKEDLLQKHERALGQIVGYLNSVVIPFIEKEWKDEKTELQKFKEDFSKRLFQIEGGLVASRPSNGSPTVGEALEEIGSRVRPSAQTLATYREPIGGGQARMAHPLDSGIAPTQEQVAQSLNVAQGGVPGQTGQLAGPAVAMPDAHLFGATGWTKPYPPKHG